MLLACHLLRDRRRRHPRHPDREAERRSAAAWPTAPRSPGHLLNVRATNMSAFADDPLHFCRWLVARQGETCDGQGRPPLFAQRRVYGRYIAELITPYLGAPGEQGPLEIVYGEAQHRYRRRPRASLIGSTTAGVITGDVAVLATGHEETAKGGPAATSIHGRARAVLASIRTPPY